MRSYVCIVIAIVILGACADENGLHNQKSSEVLFEFKNFPAADGAYSIPGDYQDWDNSQAMLTITNGSGTSARQTVAGTAIQFTLVPVGDWSRPWYSDTCKGNYADYNAAGDVKPLQNFYIEGLPEASSLVIVVDGNVKNANGEIAPYFEEN